MIDRRIARWMVVACAVLAVGVAGAATKAKRWAAGDACLCTPEAQEMPGAGPALDPARAAGYLARNGGLPSTSSSSPGPLVPESLAPGSAPMGYSAGTAAGAGSVGWTNGSRNVGAYSAGGSSRSAGLGGLWRLMSLSRRAPGNSAAAHAHTSAHRASGGGPKTPHGAPPAAGGASGSAAGSLFAEHTTTVQDLMDNGNGSAPSFGGNGSIGKPKGGPEVAANPEPGSLLLLGTGLVGICGMLRRRLTS